MADEIIKLIVVTALNLLLFGRLRSIDRTLKSLCREMRRTRTRHGRRLDRHERRIDLHDDHAGINTKEA